MRFEEAKATIQRRLEYLPTEADNWQTKVDRRMLETLIGTSERPMRLGRMRRQVMRRVDWLEKRIGERNSSLLDLDMIEVRAMTMLMEQFVADKMAGRGLQ